MSEPVRYKFVNESYNDGMERAWCLARDISNLSSEKCWDIFGEECLCDILENLDVKDAAWKMEAWMDAERNSAMQKALDDAKDEIESVLDYIFDHLEFLGVDVKDLQVNIDTNKRTVTIT